MITFWGSEAAIRAFAGDDIRVAKYTISTKISCLNWSRAPHITRCTTGEPHAESRVLSANACLRQVTHPQSIALRRNNVPNCIGVLLQIRQRTGRRIAQPMTTLYAGQTFGIEFVGRIDFLV